MSLFDENDILKKVRFNGRDILIESDNTASIVIDDYGDYDIEVVAADEAGNITDSTIHTGCYMIGKTADGYLKEGKTIMLSPPADDRGDVDLPSLLIGLGSVVGGTLGLSFKALFRQ